MSSSEGIAPRARLGWLGRLAVAALLSDTVAAASRVLQARSSRALVALVALLLCLHARRDPLPLLLAGAAGVPLLSLALYRAFGGRLLFAGANLLLLLLYVWSGQEAVRLDVAVVGAEIAAAVDGRVVRATLPRAPYGSFAVGIDSTAPPPGSPLGDLGDAISLAITTNLAAGAGEVEARSLSGDLLAGPSTYWEPDLPGPPLASDGALVAPLAGRYQLVDGRRLNDAEFSLQLRNGGPPTTLLLGLDEAQNGVAVRAWPDARTLSIHTVQRGELQSELAGGYQTLRKPLVPSIQTILRAILRSWLLALAMLAVGAVATPLASRLSAPADWRAPAWSGPLFAGSLAALALAATGWIASDVLERIPHVQDSVAYLFQARTFALGRLSVPLPPVPEAFEHEFILMRDGQWFSKYPPGHPALLALGVLAGSPWLVSPVAAALTVVALYWLGRALYGSGTGALAALLLLSSPFFLFMSGDMMSHPTGLLLTTLGLLLCTYLRRSDSFWLALAAGICLGWLVASRQLTGLVVSAVAFGWLALERVRAERRASGRPLEPLLWILVGWSWPVLGLLAYNRALTGNPLLNPFELWWSFDRLGFGPAVGMHGGHDPARGLWNTWANLSVLQTDLFGWPRYLSLAFIPIPFVTGRVRSGDLLCAMTALCLILAYVLYWADGIMYGPRYYYELAGCLALLSARGALLVAEASASRLPSLLRRRPPPSSAPLFLLLVVGLIFGNVVTGLPAAVAAERGYNYVDGRRQAVVRAAGIGQALVFVPTSSPYYWWEYGSVFSANDPLLQASVIYARDLGPETNRRVAAAFPSRTPYRLVGDRLVGI